jgi:hypothetical protein
MARAVIHERCTASHNISLPRSMIASALRVSGNGSNHILWMTRIVIASAWDGRFASSTEYGLNHVPTKIASEVVRSSLGSKAAGERDDAESLTRYSSFVRRSQLEKRQTLLWVPRLQGGGGDVRCHS